MFGRSETLPAEWKSLTEVELIPSLIADSHHKPVVIFKHSLTCGTSAYARHLLEEQWDFNPSEIDFYYLDLLTYRNVSNEIANQLGVVHQSPQMIVLHKGKVIFATSHHQVTGVNLKRVIDTLS